MLSLYFRRMRTLLPASGSATRTDRPSATLVKSLPRCPFLNFASSMHSRAHVRKCPQRYMFTFFLSAFLMLRHGLFHHKPLYGTSALIRNAWFLRPSAQPSSLYRCAFSLTCWQNFDPRNELVVANEQFARVLSAQGLLPTNARLRELLTRRYGVSDFRRQTTVHQVWVLTVVTVY